MVEFPDTAGVPQDFDLIEKIIMDILPCHLEVEFHLRYLTWEVCHQVGYTWALVRERGYNWRNFQLAVPPEGETP